MAEHHTHHHHHHHHDTTSANADHFSQRATTYRSELSLELAKRCAGVILKNYPFDANQTEVLDFACGPGLMALELLPHAKRVVGADLAQGMVDVFNRTVRISSLVHTFSEFKYSRRMNKVSPRIDYKPFVLML